MLLEMHAHTSEHSRCSRVGAIELVRQVFDKGLQGVILTDHHYLWGEAELHDLKREAAVPGYFLILSGQEVKTPEAGDVLVYGARESLPKGTPLAEIRQRFPHAAIVWAHAYRNGRLPERNDLLSPLINGVEIFSSNHTVRENSRGLRDWHAYKFTALAGTDTHGEGYAGVYPTHFDHPVADIAGVAQEIVNGRCRPFLKEIPRSGANALVTEVTIGTKGMDEVRERIIIKSHTSEQRWRSAERAHYIMEEIWRRGFHSGAYRIPQPIDSDSDSQTLIEQGMRGRSLFDKLLLSTVDDGKSYVHMTAEWLAELHNLALHITPEDEFFDKEKGRLDRYLERFEAINHPHTRKAREIVEFVRERERAIVENNPQVLVQGHGDFHPKNVFIGQDSQDNRETAFVAAIDFESSFMAPRAFDVGCFLAQFRNQFFPHKQILKFYPQQVFIDAYLGKATSLPDDFLCQVALFKARVDLSIAAYLIKVGLGDSEDLWRVLVEAEESICTAELC